MRDSRYQSRRSVKKGSGLFFRGGQYVLIETAGAGVFADGKTLPQLLKNYGYRTALVGKWHLGYEDNQSPNAHGFEYFFGFKSGYLDYYQHTNGNGEPDLWENNRLITEAGYFTDLVTEHAIEFIEDNADDAFFLSVRYNAAHWPYQPPDMPSVARWPEFAAEARVAVDATDYIRHAHRRLL